MTHQIMMKEGEKDHQLYKKQKRNWLNERKVCWQKITRFCNS